MKNIEIKIDEFVDLLNNHSSCNDNFYIDPLIMTKIIVDKLKFSISYETIKEYVKNVEVKITETEIEEYLNKKLESDDPKLKDRVINKNYIGENGKEKSVQKFMDKLFILKYSFDPYTLEYLKKYIEILKQKSLMLFDLIDKIQDNRMSGWYFNEEETNNWNELLEQLNKYDIKINQDGFVYYEDLIRLLAPLIQNVLDLKQKVDEANNLETYLTFKVSKSDLYKDGFTEEDYFPRLELQCDDEIYGNERGYIPLSDEQIEKVSKHNIDNFSSFVEIVDEATKSKIKIY